MVVRLAEQLAGWVAQDVLRCREVVSQGLEAAPQAFIRMLHGDTQGHQLVEMGSS